jgi:AraC family transcriptional regulator
MRPTYGNREHKMRKTPASEREGERRRTESIGTFALTEVTYPPGLRLQSHSHDQTCIGLTLKGRSIECFRKVEIDRPKQTVLFRPAVERHNDVIGNVGATCFLIEFDAPRIPWLAGGRLDHVGPSGFRNESIARLASRAHHEWICRYDSFELAIYGLIHEIFAEIIRADKHDKFRASPPVWLRRVKEVLDDSYNETVSLAWLAQIASVHPMHLARSFRRHFGSSVGNYLRERRIEAAKDRLLDREKSLTEIALECGFSSHAHFCGLFKHFTGLTPTEFRRLQKC